MGKKWENAAVHCVSTYGVHVDDEESFFICPECGEPIYRDDYNEELEGMFDCCPICGFEWYDC